VSPATRRSWSPRWKCAAPEVVIVLVVAQHVVGGGEHGGAHRHDGLHRPAALEAQELGAQLPSRPRTAAHAP
jgi:hypothetical protein